MRSPVKIGWDLGRLARNWLATNGPHKLSDAFFESLVEGPNHVCPANSERKQRGNIVVAVQSDRNDECLPLLLVRFLKASINLLLHAFPGHRIARQEQHQFLGVVD